MKLTKAQAKAHAHALELLRKDRLTIAERWDVFENFHEGATVSNGEIGAHFTPIGLASDMAIDMYNGGRVLDLCAGIGTLSFANAMRTSQNIDAWPEMVCIERNPFYVEIGRKLLPEAKWICADVFDLPNLGLGRFDGVISNPPYGSSAKRTGSGPRYKGRDFEFHVIDLAADYADYGCFLIPQNSAPFAFSGKQAYGWRKDGKGRDFEAQTGFEMQAGCGVDCAYYRDDWKSTNIICEIVTIEFNAQPRQEERPIEIINPATEPTQAGLQYVMPGCEKDHSRGPAQMSLF